jgi:hypothetical protein
MCVVFWKLFRKAFLETHFRKSLVFASGKNIHQTKKHQQLTTHTTTMRITMQTVGTDVPRMYEIMYQTTGMGDAPKLITNELMQQLVDGCFIVERHIAAGPYQSMHPGQGKLMYIRTDAGEQIGYGDKSFHKIITTEQNLRHIQKQDVLSDLDFWRNELMEVATYLQVPGAIIPDTAQKRRAAGSDNSDVPTP